MVTQQDPLNSNGNTHDPNRHAAGRPGSDRYDSGSEHQHSDEIHHRIERTRGAMDETLDELGERLNPRHLIDEAFAIFRSPQARATAGRAGDAAGDFVHNLGREVSRNPVATTLIGAGLAWLAFGGRKQSHASPQYEPPEELSFDEEPYYTEEELLIRAAGETADPASELYVPPTDDEVDDESPVTAKAGESFKSAAGAAGSTAKSAAQSAWQSTKRSTHQAAESTGNAASSAASTIADAFGSVAGGARAAAESVSSATSRGKGSAGRSARQAYSTTRDSGHDAYRGTTRIGRDAGRRLSSASQRGGEQLSVLADSVSGKAAQAHQEYPLAIGLGALALGALAGLAIPRTRKEDQWMGESSDRMVDEVENASAEAWRRGREAVDNTVGTAKESAAEHGLSGDSLAQRAARVVEKTVHQTSESVKQAAGEEGLRPGQVKDDIRAVATETQAQAEREIDDASSEAKTEAAEVDSDTQKATDS